MLNKNTIHVELITSSKQDLKSIEIEWRELEIRSNCHFFLTWDWLGAWVKQTRGDFYLLKAMRANKLVALAFIFEKKRKVFGFYPVTQWWLNRTGIDEFDQSWIEYNDFLIDKNYEEEVNHAIVHFIKNDIRWNEFIAGMCSEAVNEKFSGLASHHRHLMEDVGYQVNLSNIKSDYLKEFVSRNTRQKINQTKRLLENIGQIEFSVLINKDDKSSVFSKIKAFHIKRWQSTNTPSGFLNVKFESTLKCQIAKAKCEISTITLNGEVIACLINYVYRKRVYFYLSALKVFSDNKIKVGLLIHSLTIQHYQKQEFHIYDFLVGDARYKISLSNHKTSQSLVSYYRQHVTLSFESILRKLKQKLCSI